MRTGPSSSAPSVPTGSSSPRRTARSVGFVSSWLEEHLAGSGTSTSPRAVAAKESGALLVEAVIENVRARGATHLILNANLEALTSTTGSASARSRAISCCHSRCAASAAAARSARSTSRPTTSARSSGRSASSCRACPAARSGSTSRRRGTVGSRSTTTSATGTPRCCAVWPGSSRSGRVRSSLAVGVEHEQVVRFILFEAGRIVDEYLSVPEHYGALPPGDVIALAANPRVVARLTGADPAEVRAVARTALSPTSCRPRRAPRRHRGRDRARGRRARWADAPEIPDSISVQRK